VSGGDDGDDEDGGDDGDDEDDTVRARNGSSHPAGRRGA
jgi:hypothetical protein